MMNILRKFWLRQSLWFKSTTLLLSGFAFLWAIDIFWFRQLSVNSQTLARLVSSVALALALGRLFVASIRRIRLQIQASSQEVRDGNLRSRIVFTEQDELGEIFSHFNQMLVALETYQAQQSHSRRRIKELANIVKESPNPVIRLNRDYEVVYFNEAAQQIARHFSLAMQQKASQDFIDSFLLSTERQQECDMELELGDKSLRLYATYSIETECFNLFFWDISEQREAEKKMIRARDRALELSQIKSRFLATMSHEIRTPMNGVIGLSNILSETNLSAEQRELVDSILLSANSLLSIINDILDFSKIEAGKMSMEAVPMDLHRNLRECMDLFSPTAKEKNIQLNYEIDGSVPVNIECDPSRLRQVLINLIGNAVKFTDSGSVTVIARAKKQANQEHWIQFEIRDTGIGISDDLKDKLFQDFSQLDGSISRQFGGTGLGLAISKSLAKLLGGDIYVESRLGEGSSFFFEIAAKEIQNAEKIQIQEQQISLDESFAASYPLSIAIAEDNVVNQTVIKRYLGKLGYNKVSLCENGMEIVELVQSQSFAVVLMDMQMPIQSGIEASIAIMDDDAITDKPFIIAMTANAMAEDRQACEDAGMRGYIAKPLKIAEVAEALALAYGQIHAQKAA